MRFSILFLAVWLLPLACIAASPPRAVVRNTASAGGFEIVVQAAVALQTRVIVERQRKDGGWATMTNLGLDLVETCTQKLGTCVSLDAGRTLRPVPWSGMSCSSQCNHRCQKNYPMTGTYRFVVKSCDGKKRFESPPFVLASHAARDGRSRPGRRATG